MVKYLIDRGANIEAKEESTNKNCNDINGNTPMILASQNQKIEIIKYLINKGANINSTNDNFFYFLALLMVVPH